MKDLIIQEVRGARTALAADFGYDLHKFFAWAKTHAAAERKARRQLPTHPLPAKQPSGATEPPAMVRKHRRHSAITT